jgi:hypothetical protein
VFDNIGVKLKLGNTGGVAGKPTANVLEHTVTVAWTVEYTVSVAVTVAGLDGQVDAVVGNSAAVISMVIGDDFSVATVDVDVPPVPSHVQNRCQFGKIGTPFICATPWGCSRSEFMAMAKTANKARKKKH